LIAFFQVLVDPSNVLHLPYCHQHPTTITQPPRVPWTSVKNFLFWKFPLKISNFSIFSLQVKKNLFGSGQKVPGSKMDRPLIYCLSKVCSGWVGLGQGPSLLHSPITLKSWSHLVTIFVDKKGVSLSALYWLCCLHKLHTIKKC